MVYTIPVYRDRASSGSLWLLRKLRRRVISQGVVTRCEIKKECYLQRRSGEYRGTRHIKGKGGSPKQAEKNVIFKFFLSCHKIWILFHQHAGARGRSHKKESLEETPLNKVKLKCISVEAASFEERFKNDKRKEKMTDQGTMDGHTHVFWADVSRARTEEGREVRGLWSRTRLPLPKSKRWHAHVCNKERIYSQGSQERRRENKSQMCLPKGEKLKDKC